MSLSLCVKKHEMIVSTANCCGLRCPALCTSKYSPQKMPTWCDCDEKRKIMIHRDCTVVRIRFGFERIRSGNVFLPKDVIVNTSIKSSQARLRSVNSRMRTLKQLQPSR